MTPITTKTGLAAFLFLILGAAQLPAALLVNEPFDYADGSLNGQNGGTGFTGAWSVSLASGGTASWTVADGEASVSGASGTNTASRALSITSTDTTSFYFSFDVDVTTLAIPASHSFTDRLSFVSGTTRVFSTDVFVSGLGYRLKENTTSEAASTYLNANSTTADGSHTIVGKFTFDAGSGTATMSVWLDPTDENSPATWTQSWTSSVTSITGIQLARYDGFNVAGGTTTDFDNIRVGTDWDSVTAAAIPEPAACAVLLGLAAAGWAVLRRRRA